MDAIFDMICHDCKYKFINTDALLSDEDESYCACPNCKSQNIEDTIPPTQS